MKYSFTGLIRPLSVFLSAYLIVGCQEQDGNHDVPGDGGMDTESETNIDTGTHFDSDTGGDLDTDSDTATDADADMDSDADTDSDTDTDGDTDADSDGDTDDCPDKDKYPFDDQLTLYDLQFRGTHNSYHIEPDLPFSDEHRYTHQPLDVQLDEQGVRQFELDIHQTETGEYEVYHIGGTFGIDSLTTCQSFIECLETTRAWSDAHCAHSPIVIWIEIKDQDDGINLGGVTIDDIAPLDEAILSVFTKNRLLTPDDVRGSYPSLRDAIETEGWPVLGRVRGQVAFVLLNVNDERAKKYSYDYTSLDGRVMFVSATREQFDMPWAAFSKASGAADVQAALEAQIMLCNNICGAADNDDDCYAKLDDVKARGVHMLADDFPAKVDGREYWLELDDGNPLRCNPFTAPTFCTAEAIEDL